MDDDVQAAADRVRCSSDVMKQFVAALSEGFGRASGGDGPRIVLILLRRLLSLLDSQSAPLAGLHVSKWTEPARVAVVGGAERLMFWFRARGAVAESAQLLSYFCDHVAHATHATQPDLDSLMSQLHNDVNPNLSPQPPGRSGDRRSSTANHTPSHHNHHRLQLARASRVSLASEEDVDGTGSHFSANEPSTSAVLPVLLVSAPSTISNPHTKDNHVAWLEIGHAQPEVQPAETRKPPPPVTEPSAQRTRDPGSPAKKKRFASDNYAFVMR